MRIRGDHLGTKLRAQVLARFIYRNTIENPQGARMTGATLKPISDAEWLASHCFHVTKRGELDARRRSCEPAWMIETRSTTTTTTTATTAGA